MLERSLVTTKRVLRHMADITVRQTVQCLPPSQQPSCGTQVQDCNNDPQEEHVGHGGEIRKHDQYRVRVDRLDQTTLRKCLFLLDREETIKHTQPPAFVICFYTENIGKIDLT